MYAPPFRIQRLATDYSISGRVPVACWAGWTRDWSRFIISPLLTPPGILHPRSQCTAPRLNFQVGLLSERFA